jgi:hypothetical protein
MQESEAAVLFGCVAQLEVEVSARGGLDSSGLREHLEMKFHNRFDRACVSLSHFLNRCDARANTLATIDLNCTIFHYCSQLDLIEIG